MDNIGLINGFFHLPPWPSIKPPLRQEVKEGKRKNKFAPSNRKNKPYPPRGNRKFVTFFQ